MSSGGPVRLNHRFILERWFFCVEGKGHCNWNLWFQQSSDFLNTLLNATGHKFLNRNETFTFSPKIKLIDLIYAFHCLKFYLYCYHHFQKNSKNPCPSIYSRFYFIFFLWARVCWPLICLCNPFCILERWIRTHRSAIGKQACYQLSHPSTWLSHPYSWTNVYHNPVPSKETQKFWKIKCNLHLWGTKTSNI